MSDTHDDAHETIEQRLTARALLAPSHNHRERVLSAVQDALAYPRMRITPSGPTTGAIAALTAMALSSAVALIVPWILMAVAINRPDSPSIAGIRARAAGIEVPPELVVTPQGNWRESTREIAWPPLDRRYESWRIRQDFSGDL